MELGEKLQELRKKRGLTQEELADVLYVSRTAVSKWESGRGYPNLGSLKDISNYFSISIDDLLSGENLLEIADQENKENLRNIIDLLIGAVDLFSFLLIVLPLYPKTIGKYVYAVNLIAYAETTKMNAAISWILILGLILCGMIKIVFVQWNVGKYQNAVTIISMIVSMISVVFFALTRGPYVVTFVFLLFVIKSILLFKQVKTG